MLHERKASEIATGRWHGILGVFGVNQKFLTGKHGPCPICGGKDRFRFDNKEGRGTWICNQCGPGDGFDMLKALKGWSFREAAKEVESVVGTIAQTDKINDKKTSNMMAVVKRIYGESLPIERGDPAWLYLNRRIGISEAPACLRYHPALQYIGNDGDIDYHPAMVAVLSDADGKGIGLHRIYLDAIGNKAKVESAKKLLVAKETAGASVKLAPATACIGIAEGIETALAAAKLFDIPVWSAISANGLESWTPPNGVVRVVVFGDNDESFTGQASSFALARKLKRAGISVDVRIPSEIGKDWCDEL